MTHRSQLPHVDKLDYRQLSNLAWAAAVCNYESPTLFRAIGKRAETIAVDMDSLGKTVWAFAVMQVYDSSRAPA